MTYYKVMVGTWELGRTRSYAEAVEWVRMHDKIVKTGRFATLIEVIE